MHCISLTILSRWGRFPSPTVGTNWPFCVDVPLNNQPTNVNFTKHLFFIASVVDPATQHLLLFSGELCTTAYAHVHSLMQPVIAATTVGIPVGRLVSKPQSRLNPERVDTLIFVYEYLECWAVD